MIRGGFGRLGLIIVLSATGTSAVAATGFDDEPPPGKASRAANRPPSGKAKARAKGRLGGAQPAGNDVTPPDCQNSHRPRHAGRPAQRGLPPLQNGVPLGFGAMPRVYGEMMDSLARNPAGGFQDFLARQEGHAIHEVTLSAEEERRIGRKQRQEYLQAAKAKGFDVVQDADKRQYLKDLVEALSRHMSHRDRYRDISIMLISAPIPDGQSFPGGSLVFTTALLDEPDEATVAGVVAHELAHLDRGHLYEYARRAKLSEAGFRAPGPGADFDRVMTHNMALGSLMMNPFRPEHEMEADCTATTWLYLEGYDPRALVRFFDRLHERTRDQPDQPFFRFARSHPYSLDRGSEVLDRLGQLRGWKNRDDLGLYPDNLRRLECRRRELAEQNVPGRGEAAGDRPRRRDDRPDAD